MLVREREKVMFSMSSRCMELYENVCAGFFPKRLKYVGARDRTGREEKWRLGAQEQ